MSITPTSATPGLPTSAASAPDARPQTPEEAAQQFEKLLVHQLVQTMTDGLFDGGLEGANGPSWMQGQQDLQRDTLAQVLTDHLVDSNRLGLADRLLQNWQHRGLVPPASGAAPDPTADASAEAPSAPSSPEVPS